MSDIIKSDVRTANRLHYIRKDDGAIMVEVRAHEYVNVDCLGGYDPKPEPKSKTKKRKTVAPTASVQSPERN